MIILFTYPESVHNETILLNRFMEQHPSLIVHLRKPTMDQASFKQLIREIAPEFHARIVLHQHHDLDAHYVFKGVHFTEAHRLQHPIHPRVVSTSFHRTEDARNEYADFSYCFCSPVFPSISKTGYVPVETWDITAESADFRSKAVALGGIDLSRLQSVRERGFEHIAVLGAIWHDPQPESALDQLFDRF